MDTKRIIINNYDLSTVSEEQQTTISTYTVVKSPRGMITPLRIPAGSAAKLKDIYGVSSKEYPELFEVESINPYYDTYISAPYSSAKIPVAVVTGDGIFPLSETVTYDEKVEDLVTGNNDEDTIIPGITSFVEGSFNILKDTRYPLSNNIASGAETDYSNTYPSYKGTTGYSGTPAMLINTGLTKLQLIQKLKATKDIRFKVTDLPEIVEGVNSVNLIVSAGSNSGNVYQEVTGGSQPGKIKIGEIRNLKEGTFGEEGTASTDIMYFFITGADTSNSNIDFGEAITDTYVRNSLGLEANRQPIRVYWVEALNADNAFATIFPKYPSTDAVIHLSFDAFNKSKGYDGNALSGRNLIKITAYDEKAFHNVNHTISFSGSLDELAKSSSGVSLGFTDSNADYTEQDLVHVHVIKPFTNDKQITNKKVSQYPSIVLKGGEKLFETDTLNSVGLHNKGWNKATDDEYADVAYFFDSTRNTYQSLYGGSSEDDNIGTRSTFFDLAAERPQSGFIYNFTVDPNEIGGLTPLDLGFNYWNLCNEAIINLPNGNGKITSPCTGERTRMQCLAEERKYGGAAIMFTNVNGVGGQLNLDPVRVRYKYNKNQQMELDDLNFNPMILDHTYGLMVVGNKTSKVGETSDWSYISNTASYLVFEREVKNTVLILQIGKANNPYYRNIRKQQVENLLRKRLEGSNRIWAQGYVQCDTSPGCNDEAARRNRRFVINCGIKSEIFSEFVEFNFTTYDQSIDLTVINANTINGGGEG